MKPTSLFFPPARKSPKSLGSARPPSSATLRPLRFVPLPLLFVWCLAACDRSPRSSQPAPSPSPEASPPVDAPDAAVDASALAVTDPSGPVDASPLLARARALYVAPATTLLPPARRVTVVGNALVLLSMDDSIPLPAVAGFVGRVLRAYSTDRFGRLPVDPVFILLFPTSDALAKWSGERYGAAEGNLGTFDRDRREIAVDLSHGEHSWPTVAHELVHVIVSDGKAGDFESIPLWFNECLASVFESPRWDADGGIHGAKWSRRYKLITDALRSPATRDTARFDALFGMSDEEFRGIDPAVGPVATLRDPKERAAAHARMLLHYASARYACVWLDDQGKLFPMYRAWRDGFASDPQGLRAFESVVGKPPAAVQEEWMAWVPKP
jgi:hypothetical protein